MSDYFDWPRLKAGEDAADDNDGNEEETNALPESIMSNPLT